jgi:hypothetical protein
MIRKNVFLEYLWDESHKKAINLDYTIKLTPQKLK